MKNTVALLNWLPVVRYKVVFATKFVPVFWICLLVLLFVKFSIFRPARRSDQTSKQTGLNPGWKVMQVGGCSNSRKNVLTVDGFDTTINLHATLAFFSMLKKFYTAVTTFTPFKINMTRTYSVNSIMYSVHILRYLPHVHRFRFI